MILVELTRKWKDKELNEKEVKEIFNNIKIFEPIEEDGEIYHINENNNSWADIVADNYLTREERIEFKKLVNYIKC